MPIKIAICDDREEDIRQLSEALHSYNPSFEIVTYTDGEALVDEFRGTGFPADILFLDIYMPGIDGIKTAQSIIGEKKDIKIIFISSSKEHYPQAYEVFAFNYLLKPLDRERLYSVLDRAVEEMSSTGSRKLYVHYKSVAYSVKYRDILYIESRDKLLLFHQADGSTLQCYGKLEEMAKELSPERSFIRCHQSFIVNASSITEMGENYFRIGPAVISISKKYLKLAKEQYYSYLFSHMGRGVRG